MNIKCKSGTLTILCVGFVWAGLSACVHTDSKVEVTKPIEVKVDPLEATLNVNVNVRIQREVNDLYDSIYGPSGSPAATTQPKGS